MTENILNSYLWFFYLVCIQTAQFFHQKSLTGTTHYFLKTCLLPRILKIHLPANICMAIPHSWRIKKMKVSSILWTVNKVLKGRLHSLRCVGTICVQRKLLIAGKHTAAHPVVFYPFEGLYSVFSSSTSCEPDEILNIEPLSNATKQKNIKRARKAKVCVLSRILLICKNSDAYYAHERALNGKHSNMKSAHTLR